MYHPFTASEFLSICEIARLVLDSDTMHEWAESSLDEDLSTLKEKLDEFMGESDGEFPMEVENV